MSTQFYSDAFAGNGSLARALTNLGLIESLAGKHLLLTGGTGFFGRWLLALLGHLNKQGAGIEVTVTSRNPSAFLSANPDYSNCNWMHWLPGDIRELRSVPGRPLSLILHAATDTSAEANSNPLELFDTIVLGARRIYDIAVRNEGVRVLVTGSGAQYGNIADLGAVPETYSGACISNDVSSVYGEAKRVQETLGSIYAEYRGVDVVMARCFAFSGFGLPLNGHFAIGNFVRDAVYSDEVLLTSGGTAVRSYLHGADLALWLLTLLVRGQGGKAYNVGSDEAITIADLARRVVDRVAPDKRVRILGRSESSARSHYVPDITCARELGLDVWTSLDESIDSMVHWARLHSCV